MITIFSLLRREYFLPVFVVQFLGALNGNICKNATIVLSLYRLGRGGSDGGTVMATAAAGMFVLPFLLFSATAGHWADNRDKASLIRWTKGLEIFAALCAVAAFQLESRPLLLAALFLLGSQAAWFGPLKYGILPDHLPKEALLAANGLIEASTFIAILAGTMLGSLTVLGEHGIFKIQAMLLAVAIAGWAASLFVPSAPPRRRAPLDARMIAHSLALFRRPPEEPPLLPTMMGVSWFWLVGALFLAQFPAVARQLLQADASVVSLFLTMFSIGIGAGSLLVPRLLRGAISQRFGGWGLLGMAGFGGDFVLAAHPLGAPDALIGIGGFLQHPNSWRLLADLAALALAAGIYVVPQYAMLQSLAAPERRARVIAANNVLNALFMVVSAGLAAALLSAGFTVAHILLGIAAANLLLGALRLIRPAPDCR